MKILKNDFTGWLNWYKNTNFTIGVCCDIHLLKCEKAKQNIKHENK